MKREIENSVIRPRNCTQLLYFPLHFLNEKIRHELAMYQHGLHGQGLAEGSEVIDGALPHGHPWTAKCLAFLTGLGMVDRPS